VALLGLEVALIPDRRTTLAGIDSRPETSPAFRNGLDAVRRPQQVGQATALAAGWLDVAVLVGQLTGDALPQTVEMTHELGQGTGGAHAERSVLTASSKARISSCSLSLSRWGSPTAASPWGLAWWA
jgi:hypothetical protein